MFSTGLDMNKTISVTLAEPLTDFVERMIQKDRYTSISDVVGNALYLLEQKENQQELLREAIDEGDSSGETHLTITQIAAQRKVKLSV